jgi:UDPglucose--hexose-1-phosphate uridylyltransferase
MVWEERWHPLREEWVSIAAHRQDRPWHGDVVGKQTRRNTPEYIKDCYLCPGNARVRGVRNDNYDGIFVFDNDHPCVGPDAPRDLETPSGIYRNRPANGLARVLCYSPKHNSSLSELTHGAASTLNWAIGRK